MHELGFDHAHMTPEEREHLAEVIWGADNVEFTTVGVDIGSATSHLMFARVHLQRLTTALSSRFVVVNREVLWRSPILITPYLADDAIAVDRLASFIDAAYESAGLARDDVDTGAVILTGEALKRRNAETIAHLFAAEAGKFVCASAGHHLESAMAAHGSGAVNLSRQGHSTILNVDMGGGTTKLGLVHGGRLLHAAALEVGGRLIAFDDAGKLARIEAPARKHAAKAGIELKPGKKLSDDEITRFAAAMTEALVRMILQQPPAGLDKELLLTEPLPDQPKPDAVTFSGGVSEYIYGRETADHNDVGRQLAAAVTLALKDRRIPYKVYDPGQGIRATVIGASQFSVQVSGNTISISNHHALPIRNLPVLHPNVDLGGDIVAARVADEIGKAHVRFDFTEGKQPVALALRWRGDPLHARLKALADGICAGLARTIKSKQPLVLMLDGDIGKTLGEILRRESGVPGDIISVDGVQLKEFDYVDIGEVVRPTNVVPLVIKSLLFSSPAWRADG